MSHLTPAAEAVIGKIQKLLNQANDKGIGAAEKDAFQAKAQALMLQHNLDTATVERNAGTTGKREQALVEGGFYRWQRELWDDVADVNFCTYWSQVHWVRVEDARRKYRTGGTYVVDIEVRRRRHALIGRTVNVRATEVMARYLEQATARAVDERFPDRREDGYTASFREGVAYRLGQRLRARRREILDKERREMAARDRAARSGVSTATAITVTSYTRSEKEANIDFRYGEGTSARWAADRAAAAAERQAAEEEYTRWAAAHPDEARAKEEAQRKKDARRDGRASRERFGKVKDGTFWQGVDAGEKISLDPQVDAGQAKKIGGRR